MAAASALFPNPHPHPHPLHPRHRLRHLLAFLRRFSRRLLRSVLRGPLVAVVCLAVALPAALSTSPASASTPPGSAAVTAALTALAQQAHPAASLAPSGDAVFDVDLGQAFDKNSMQAWIDSTENANPLLSDTLKRTLEDYPVANEPPPDLSNAPAFSGTLTIDADGTGVTLTVPAGQVQASSTWWQAMIAQAGGMILGGLVTVGCLLVLPAFGPFCGSAGGFFGSFFVGFFNQAFDGTLGNANEWAKNIAASLVVAAVSFGVAGFIESFAGKTLSTLLNDAAEWVLARFAASGAWGWLGFATRAPGWRTFLADMAQSLPSAVRNELPGAASLPCDVYAADGAPCVGAYSTVRALYASYSGPMYQVSRASDNTTADIGLLATGGYVNAATQDSFCSGTTCVITKLYDQSPEGNHLTLETGNGPVGADRPANATALPITVAGHKAYGVDIQHPSGYRDNAAKGLAVNGKPEGMYMVTSGTHVNSGCCFDFGNVEPSQTDNGAGTMDALNFTTACVIAPCSGPGPWVEADLENGQYMGSGPNPNETGNSSNFVTALLKNNGQTTFALKGGDATTGGLTTWYNGALPNGYAPMKQQGALVLGTGGDNSNWSDGSFFEGAITSGYPSDGADDTVQSNIVSNGYSGNSSPAGFGTGLSAPAGRIMMAGGKCVDVQGDDTGGNLTPVQSWDCQASAVDQHWTANANGSLETLGRCLSVSIAVGVAGSGKAVAGDHTDLYDCNGSAVEKWSAQPDGTLRNPDSGLCLYGQPSNGYQLQVVTCQATDPDQQFAVTGGSPITSSGKCVDVQGDDTGTDTTPVQLWDCQSTAADQHWYYDPAAHTLGTLGKCLDVSTAVGVGGTGTAGAGNHTTLWDCNGSGVEQWIPQANGTMKNPPSGLCLYGQPTNGYQLQVVTCNATDPDQKFVTFTGGIVAGAAGAASGTITLPSGKCVDVAGDDTGGDGASVEVWDCQSTAVDQHWTHNADGSLETLGRCLTVSVGQGVGGAGQGTPGNHATLWDCNGSGAENWSVQPDGTIVNPPSGLCLDDPNGNQANGWQLQVWQCLAGDSNQQFRARGGSPITISGKCIDVAGDDTGGNGAAVGLWDCQSGSADQHWFYDNAKHTFGTLGRCLNVSTAVGVGGTGTAAAGDHLTLWDCDGSGVEQWIPQPNGSILNPPTGLCVDLPGGNTSNGWQLQVASCADGDSAQNFAVYDHGTKLVNGAVHKCVDVQGNDNGGDLAPVQMWDCLPGARDQHWIYNSLNEFTTLGRCLSVSTAVGVAGTGTGTSGDHVVLYDCNGSDAEVWVADGFSAWRNPSSNLCLDDPAGNGTNGTQLIVWSCNGQSNQEFDTIS